MPVLYLLYFGSAMHTEWLEKMKNSEAHNYGIEYLEYESQCCRQGESTFVHVLQFTSCLRRDHVLNDWLILVRFSENSCFTPVAFFLSSGLLPRKGGRPLLFANAEGR